MNIVLYDGSFEGLLTAVFEIYEYKIEQPKIFRSGAAPTSLFGKMHEVEINRTKSNRVFKKLQDKLSPAAKMQLYKTFLSEIKDIENVLLRYIQYVINSDRAVENDFSNPDVLLLQQLSRKVHREKHRMEAFVRFQRTKDDLYYCIIQPDFNVLPLISRHFEKRYADQCWLIYDSLRKFGLYYDKEKVEEVSMNFDTDLQNRDALKALYDDGEELYQRLWQQYFSSVNITARKNMKLHIQHMPRRYWRYLVEKQGRLEDL
ncbi:MAG: domain often clustered or fused with uracil-DNA glycosylase [Ferruginibacter sp.]|nr:domain often clustered or fused with uracil-DNA glycosylase [Ferruginibacter sp.]